MDFSYEESGSNWSPESRATSRIISLAPSMEPSPSKKTKIWHKELRTSSHSESTKANYKQYNNKFIVWMNERYGAGTTVEEENVREFIQEYALNGLNTMVVVAALKFRFNECEKRDFSFKRLR